MNKMPVYTILLFCTAILNCFGNQTEFENDGYYLFDSKTPYMYVRKQELNIPNGCHIQQIFALIRHGTRTCSSQDDKDILALEPLKKLIKKTDKLTEDDINAIKNWTNDKNNDKDLNDQGIEDMNVLSSSIKNSFGDIFKDKFNHKIHKVLTSPETRAKESALHFLKNAFEHNIDIKTIKLLVYEENDVTLNVDKLRTDRVPKAEKKMKKTPLTEMDIFRSGPEMDEVRERIANKLGLTSPVTYEQAKAMYESCRHEKATYLNTTPAWCRVFAKKDIQVIEYLNDMNWFYKFGYGNNSCIRLGCPLLTRLNLSFKLAAQKKGARAVFYFGHRANQFVSITMLGLAKDNTPLKADNMEQMANRNWRTSHLNPFAANTIGAFYKCDDGKDRVSFFVNEKIMTIDLDDNSTCSVCLWEKVEQKFDRITADKNYCAFGNIISPP